MEMKNKLFRHHKSKLSLFARNFSLACVGVFMVLGGIAIPTYFSISSNLNIVTQASEENTTNLSTNPDDNPDENVDEESEEEVDSENEN